MRAFFVSIFSDYIFLVDLQSGGTTHCFCIFCKNCIRLKFSVTLSLARAQQLAHQMLYYYQVFQVPFGYSPTTPKCSMKQVKITTATEGFSLLGF